MRTAARTTTATVAAGALAVAGTVLTGTAALADDDASSVPFLPVGTELEQDPGDGAFLSPVDTRFGTHTGFDRVVLELAGEGTPGWFVQYDDDPRYQGSGFEVDIDGSAFLSVSVTGVVYPTEEGAVEYEGPEEIRPDDAGVVEHVVVGGIFEGHQELFIGLSSAERFRVFTLEDPTRVVIDVEHAPFAVPIAWLLEEGIATGYDDGEFRGDRRVSRQAMAAFVHRLATDGAEVDDCDVSPFRDVPVDHPFCGEIAWLADTGLTTGYDDGTFRPSRGISRQAMAAFFQRLFDGGEPAACGVAPFVDVRTDHPFCPEIFWMLNQEISTGYDDLTYRPERRVSRQAMAAFMYRAVVEQGLVTTTP